MSQDPYTAPGPQISGPQISPEQERQWGMFGHLAPLAAMVLSAGTLGFVGSLVIYLMYKDKGPFVRAHSANSLNIQITTAIVLLISIPLVFLVGLGVLTALAAIVAAFILHIIGAVKANSGEWWDPPMTWKLIR
ncbi:MAG: DUF4870 domain-containing protein [Nocardioides sp.]